ncbi:MAG TPA: radical SAM protein [Candidatus Dormibacteraeota bacterium]|nr:radical SAM protein [Candidatus Dormibacteraeota bacterium]
MPVRDDRILRYVTAFCPACHAEDSNAALESVARLSGYLSEAGGHVWLVRGCPRHGRMVTFYDESPEILAYLEQWTAPTKVHTPDTAGNYAPVPAAYLNGLGEMQTQHTCILLEDVIAGCNLTCPTCFADSSPHLRGIVPIKDVLANVDQRLAREKDRIDVVMISGGEPTLHPDLPGLLDELVARNIVRILINTNGIQIARDDELLRVLEKHNRRVEVYLQFDGLRLETHRHHRGADLRKIKREAINRLSSAGVFMTLTMTAALDVNDDEIGDVVMTALNTPFVGGVCIQPQFGSGRSGHIDLQRRLTHTGVLRRLEAQTGGVVTWRDLTSLPCSHPHCASVGYMLRTDAGEWRSLVGIVGHEQLKEHLDLVSNRVADREIPAQLRELVKASFMGLLSEQSSLTHPTIAELFRNICNTCDIGLGTMLRLAGSAAIGDHRRLRRLLAERVKRITIKPFMDVSTMLEERLIQCCVHVGTQSERQHQCAPFCAVQAWPQLSAMKLAERAQRSVAADGLPVMAEA